MLQLLLASLVALDLKTELVLLPDLMDHWVLLFMFLGNFTSQIIKIM
jgi:hypothetical protein